MCIKYKFEGNNPFCSEQTCRSNERHPATTMDNATPSNQPSQTLPHPNSQNITGALATDASGLCLGYRGDANPDYAGNYAAIIKLAGRLDPNNSSKEDGNIPPTVIIEGEESATLIKEYHGRTVVFKVPVMEGKKDDVTPNES